MSRGLISFEYGRVALRGHTERFRFFAPWRWVAEPYLRAWLANNVREEMVRLKEILEAEG